MQTNSKIDIKFKPLFPWHFLFLAGVIFIAALAFISQEALTSLFLIAGCLFVFTSFNGIEIDTVNKYYREYTAFFYFLRSGKKVKYLHIEKLYINRAKVTQRMYSARTTQSSTFSNTEYNAYIKFDNEEKIQLLNKRNKETLVRELQKVSDFLKVPVTDNTALPKPVA
jgi:hypothetical protein